MLERFEENCSGPFAGVTMSEIDIRGACSCGRRDGRVADGAVLSLYGDARAGGERTSIGAPNAIFISPKEFAIADPTILRVAATDELLRELLLRHV